MGKLIVGVARVLLLCAVLLVFPSIVAAIPIAAPGTEGLEVVVSSTSPVIATYQGNNSATFSNDLYLVVDGNPANDRFLFNNHGSPVGSKVNLGSFPVGTALVFRLHVRNTGIDYFTGPGSRNPDGKPHARAQADWLPNETLVSFEDNVDFAYNDLSFSFVPTTAVNPLADLILTAIQYNPADLVPGRTVTFDSGIQNAGAQGTGVFNIRWFVDGVSVGYGSHGGVPANSTVLDGNSAYAWPATAGTYTITFAVDVDNHVGESNESNNSGSVTVTVAATQVQITDKPEGKAPNLIILVHGCCTNANDVTKDWDSFANLIKDAIIQNQTPGAWEIVVWDWSKDTHKYNYLFNCLLPGGIGLLSYCVISDALTAYNNAELQAANLTTSITPYPYKYIHMIGHSSGARLIDMTAKDLADLYNNVSSLKDRPFIHLTFLDAYTLNDEDSGQKGYGNLEGYPDTKHYAEHYVDIGLPSTDAILQKAFNFIITDWKHSLIEDWPLGHLWPLYWYKKSVTTSEFNYGFPLSLEGGGGIDRFNELAEKWSASDPPDPCILKNETTENPPSCVFESAPSPTPVPTPPPPPPPP